MSIKISAVICTYNRAGYLEKAIKSLLEQTLSKEQREIVVIDNASTDNTKQVCVRYAQFIKYSYEPTIGLSQARNTGWECAQGKYVAYLDDDAIAAPDWLEKILVTFESVKPQPGAIGGKVEPIWETERPAWLSDKLLGQLAILDWGKDAGLFSKEEWFVGANMAFPRFVLKEAGGFDTALGRKGDNLLSMEENLLRAKIEKNGHNCYYDPKIIIRHHILRSRLTQKWFLERAYWNGISNAIVDMRIDPIPFPKRLIKSIATLSRILISPKELFYWLVPTDNPDIFLKKCSVYARFGHVVTL